MSTLFKKKNLKQPKISTHQSNIENEIQFTIVFIEHLKTLHKLFETISQDENVSKVSITGRDCDSSLYNEIKK